MTQLPLIHRTTDLIGEHLVAIAAEFPPGDYRFRHLTLDHCEFEGRVHLHEGVLRVRSLATLGPLCPELAEQPGVRLDWLVGRFEITPLTHRT